MQTYVKIKYVVSKFLNIDSKSGENKLELIKQMSVVEMKCEEDIENEKLILAILKSDIDTILGWKRSWNFFGMIEGRKTRVTPLSVLCRPQLCDALKDCDPQQQRHLVQRALKSGADPWLMEGEGGKNARAITDTVYQGDVEILKMFLNEGVATKEQIKDYRLYGASLLHMACYDSRVDMIRFLVEEMDIDPKLHDNAKQQPLFWIFARGPVKLEAAEYLVELGCDPKEKVTMMKVVEVDGKRTKVPDGCYLSPLSMAIRTFPEFVEGYLQSQFSVVSNRGLMRTVRFSWRDLLTERNVDKDTKAFVYAAPKFAMVLPAKENVWETLNYDRDPKDMKTYMEMMLTYERKAALQCPIVSKPTYIMWNDFSKWCFYRQVFSFFIIWAMVFVGMFVWPSRETAAAQMEDGSGFESPLISRICMIITVPFVLYLVFIEYKEITTLGRWKKYIKDFWNYSDFFLLTAVIFLCVLVNTVHHQDYEAFLWSYRVISCIAVIVHIMLATKGIQFAAVPALTSPMVSMILLMLRDVASFGMVWILLYLGYGQALWMLWKNTIKETEISDLVTAEVPDEIVEENYLWWDPFFHLWNWMLGDGVGDFPETLGNMEHMEEQILAFTLHYSWVVVMTIMLFNMLIAMMGNTYQLVADEQKAMTNKNFIDRVQNLWLCAGPIRDNAHHKKLWDDSDKNTDEDAGDMDYDEEPYAVTPEWAKDLSEQLDNVMEAIQQQSSKSKEKARTSAVKQRRHSLIQHSKQDKRMRLYVKIESAKGLRMGDLGTDSDPYCKVYVCKGSEKIHNDRTDVINNDSNPVWHWTSGELYAEGFDNLVFEVMDNDVPGKKDDYLGEVTITLDEINEMNGSLSGIFDIMYKKIPSGTIKLQVGWVSDPTKVIDAHKRLDALSKSPATPQPTAGQQEQEQANRVNLPHDDGDGDGPKVANTFKSFGDDPSFVSNPMVEEKEEKEKLTP